MELGTGGWIAIFVGVATVISMVCDVIGVYWGYQARQGGAMVSGSPGSLSPSIPVPKRRYIAMPILVILAWAAVGFDYWDRHPTFLSGWRGSYRPIPVNNKTFRNQEVLLDGYAYDHCTFENVTFVYNGTTPPSNVFPTVKGFELKTDSVAVEGAWAIVVGLGLLDSNMKFEFSNPNTIVRPPGEPVE